MEQPSIEDASNFFGEEDLLNEDQGILPATTAPVKEAPKPARAPVTVQRATPQRSSASATTATTTTTTATATATADPSTMNPGKAPLQLFSVSAIGTNRPVRPTPVQPEPRTNGTTKYPDMKRMIEDAAKQDFDDMEDAALTAVVEKADEEEEPKPTAAASPALRVPDTPSPSPAPVAAARPSAPANGVKVKKPTPATLELFHSVKAATEKPAPSVPATITVAAKPKPVVKAPVAAPIPPPPATAPPPVKEKSKLKLVDDEAEEVGDGEAEAEENANEYDCNDSFVASEGEVESEAEESSDAEDDDYLANRIPKPMKKLSCARKLKLKPSAKTKAATKKRLKKAVSEDEGTDTDEDADPEPPTKKRKRADSDKENRDASEAEEDEDAEDAEEVPVKAKKKRRMSKVSIKFDQWIPTRPTHKARGRLIDDQDQGIKGKLFYEPLKVPVVYEGGDSQERAAFIEEALKSVNHLGHLEVYGKTTPNPIVSVLLDKEDHLVVLNKAEARLFTYKIAPKENCKKQTIDPMAIKETYAVHNWGAFHGAPVPVMPVAIYNDKTRKFYAQAGETTPTGDGDEAEEEEETEEPAVEEKKTKKKQDNKKAPSKPKASATAAAVPPPPPPAATKKPSASATLKDVTNQSATAKKPPAGPAIQTKLIPGTANVIAAEKWEPEVASIFKDYAKGRANLARLMEADCQRFKGNPQKLEYYLRWLKKGAELCNAATSVNGYIESLTNGTSRYSAVFLAPEAARAMMGTLNEMLVESKKAKDTEAMEVEDLF